MTTDDHRAVDGGATGAAQTQPVPVRDVAALEAEIERLRRRNAELESPTAVRARHAARTTAVVILTIIGALCLTLAVPAVWARNQVLDTDRYVTTMEPLASNADVQASVEAAVNRQIAARLDIGAYVDQALQALPPQAARLKAPIESGVSGLIGTAVHKAVTSDAFVTLWTAANRAGHAALVSLLTGEDQGTAVTVSSNGAVVLNLGPIIEQVKVRLVAAGLGIAQNIPTVGATIEIAQLQGVDKAQQVVRWLNTAANWLPWIGLVVLAGAVALARGRRRRALLWAALSTAIGLLLLRIALVVLREVYLDQMPTDVITPQASAYIFDTVTRFLRDGIRLDLHPGPGRGPDRRPARPAGRHRPGRRPRHQGRAQCVGLAPQRAGRRGGGRARPGGGRRGRGRGRAGPRALEQPHRPRRPAHRDRRGPAARRGLGDGAPEGRSRPPGGLTTPAARAAAVGRPLVRVSRDTPADTP